MAGIKAWPMRQPPPGEAQMQTLYGRRRLDWFSRHANGFKTELKQNGLVRRLAGSKWQCSHDSEGGKKARL